jgi:predicted CxxxxCH...CXXCH cytochrome family protein
MSVASRGKDKIKSIICANNNCHSGAKRNQPHRSRPALERRGAATSAPVERFGLCFFFPLGSFVHKRKRCDPHGSFAALISPMRCRGGADFPRRDDAPPPSARQERVIQVWSSGARAQLVCGCNLSGTHRECDSEKVSQSVSAFRYLASVCACVE